LQIAQQLTHRSLQYRMDRFGSYRRQGLQHEESLVHARMGQCQDRRLKRGLTMQQQIEIDGARVIFLSTNSLQAGFNVMQELQKIMRIESGLQLSYRIEVLPLSWRAADRLGFLIRRHFGHLYVRMRAQPGQRLVKILLAIAEIASERDIGDLICRI